MALFYATALGFKSPWNLLFKIGLSRNPTKKVIEPR